MKPSKTILKLNVIELIVLFTVTIILSLLVNRTLADIVIVMSLLYLLYMAITVLIYRANKSDTTNEDDMEHN